MKKSRKHTAFSTLLAIFMLSAQVAFFPLHFYLTHHNTAQHAQQKDKQHFQQEGTEYPLTNSFEDEGCFWCDLFAHQDYYSGQFAAFCFSSAQNTVVPALVFVFASLQPDLPGSRAPPIAIFTV